MIVLSMQNINSYAFNIFYIIVFCIEYFKHLYDTPNYTGNKFNKNGERIEKSKAAYEPDDSDSDTDDDDSGDEDNAGTDDDGDKADDGDYGDKVNYVSTEIPSNQIDERCRYTYQYIKIFQYKVTLKRQQNFLKAYRRCL